MNSVMIDIETLATSPDSVVVSIAAVEFNPFEVTTNLDKLASFQLLVDIDDQVINYNRVINDDTVAWWSKQSQAVQDVLFAEEGRVTLTDALTQLTKFCWHKDRIFAQGPQFDMTILEHCYNQTKQVKAWQYWAVRDARTLMDLVVVEQPIVTHDSIEDCKRQITGVQKVLKALNITSFARK